MNRFLTIMLMAIALFLVFALTGCKSEPLEAQQTPGAERKDGDVYLRYQDAFSRCYSIKGKDEVLSCAHW